MNRVLVALIVLSVALLLGTFGFQKYEDVQARAAITRNAKAAQAPLFERLGGKPAIEAVTDDFLGRLVHEPRFQRIFANAPTEVLTRVRNHVVDQLCEATGGPCQYKGRDMQTVHKGMAITEADWAATVDLLQQTMTKFHVGQREQEELSAIVATTRAAIVESGN